MLYLIGVGWMGDAHARSYKRRERSMNECRSSVEPNQQDMDKARRYYESGILYYEDKQYQKARQEFQSAYDISHLPDFLINLYTVCVKLDQYKDAIKYLEDYIQECPNAPDVQAARQKLDDLKIAQAIKESGEKPPPPKPVWPPKAALVLMGAGAGMLLIGASVGGGALTAAGEVSDPKNQGTAYTEGLKSAEGRGKALEATAITFDVIGALALGAGAIWTGAWYYERKTGFSLTAAPRPGGLVLFGSFR